MSCKIATRLSFSYHNNVVNKMATKRRCRSVSAPFGYYCSQIQCRLNLLKGNGAIKRAVRRMSDENVYRNPTLGKAYAGIPIRGSKSEPSPSSSMLERSSSSKSTRSTHILRLPSATETRRSFHLKLSSTPIMQLPRINTCRDKEKHILNEEQLRYLYPNAKSRDLYFINIEGHYFSKIDKNLMEFCVNVISIDAGENNLDLECFRHFPNLRELLLPLNNIKHIDINDDDFPALTVLDLSCNYISPTAIFMLGHLSNLKMLDLSYNNLQHLPIGLQPGNFSGLDTLILDYNSISDPTNFKSLSRLQSLRTLSLKNNKITHLPFIETKRTHNSVKMQMETLGVIEGFPRVTSPVSGSLDDSLPLGLKLRKRVVKPKNMSKVSHTYFRDEKNDILPFPKLQQLDLTNNKIKDVKAILAVKTWKRMKALVVVGNRINSLSSYRLDKIKEYLVLSFNIDYVQFSHRVYDVLLDPFHNDGLLGKFLYTYKRDVDHCGCHQKTALKHEELDFNLDITSASPKGTKTLPLPNQRLCTFKLLSQPEMKSHEKFKYLRRSKFRSDSAILAETWQSIADHVAPSTLPSTIRAAKTALQQALQNDPGEMQTSKHLKPLISEPNSTSSKDEAELFSQTMRKQLLTQVRFGKIDYGIL